MSRHDHAPRSLVDEVLGVAPEDNGAIAILKAYATLTGEELSTDEFLERYDRFTKLAEEAGEEDLDLYKLTPDVRDQLVTMTALECMFLRQQTFGNNLVDWPLYQTLYRQHLRPSEDVPLDKSQRNALLIGSLTMLSSQAFKQISTTVYDAAPYIIDLESSNINKEKSRGTFVYGSGLRYIPFQDETMDVVHTNQLLHMIVGGEKEMTGDPDPEAMTQLLEESFRVLRPNGQLLMREVTNFDPTDRNYQLPRNQARLRKFGAGVHRTLRSIGFGDISLTRATRHQGVDFLLDPERRFDEFPVEQTNGLAIIAQKP
jgi:SAM-dependent methyltransferase